jgi:hypothetical protein
VLIRLIRCLDGIIYVLIATVLLLVHPSLGRDELGHLDLIAVLPLAIIACVCARVPLHFSQIRPQSSRVLGGLVTWSPSWPQAVFRLRLFAIALAALAPLAILWTTLPTNRYLMGNMFWAIIAALGLLFNLLVLANQIASFTGQRDLAIEARSTAYFIFYLLLGAHLAVSSIVIALEWSALDVFNMLGFTSVLLKLAFGSVTLYTMSILIRAQHSLARHTSRTLKEQLPTASPAQSQPVAAEIADLPAGVAAPNLSSPQE